MNAVCLTLRRAGYGETLLLSSATWRVQSRQLFLEMHNGMIRGNGQKLEHGQFQLGIRKRVMFFWIFLFVIKHKGGQILGWVAKMTSRLAFNTNYSDSNMRSANRAEHHINMPMNDPKEH